ncbi:hypothetical protein CRYUN_Cryun22dG0055900 [Craigia yunnanensis]
MGSKPDELTPLVHLENFLTMAVADVAAIGFGLPKDAFTSLMQQSMWINSDIEMKILNGLFKALLACSLIHICFQMSKVMLTVALAWILCNHTIGRPTLNRF